MTSLIARRLLKLEQAKVIHQPPRSLVLIGLEHEVEEQYRAALAEERYRPGDPVMRIILAAPRMSEEGRALP